MSKKRVPRSAERGQRLCLWTPPPLKRWTKLSDALRAARKIRKRTADLRSFFWWGRVDSNHRRHCQQIYSLSPLATREHPRVRFTQRGAGGRTRTPDLLITNQLLYQLSYTSLLICFLSTDVLYYIISKTDCQEFFKNFLIFFTLGFISFCCAVTTDNILSQSQTFVNPFSTIF